jgi:uncharacterized integral membrane protein
MVLIFQNSKEVTLSVVALQLQLPLFLIIAFLAVATYCEYGTENNA